MKLTKVAGMLVLLALSGACGTSGVQPSGGGSVHVAEESPGAGGKAELPSQATLRKYFDGIAAATVSGYGDAIEVAQPGAPAAAYATYLRAAAQALIDGGEPVHKSDAVAEVKEGGYQFCEGTASANACYRYTDITGADGKVANFSVNGKPLAGRLSVGNGTPVAVQGLDAKASFVAAFESSAGDRLFVVVRLEAGGKPLSDVEATYRPPGDSESRSARTSGPSELAAGSQANYAFAFPKARIAGTLTLSAHDTDSGEVGTVTLPTS